MRGLKKRVFNSYALVYQNIHIFVTYFKKFYKLHMSLCWLKMTNYEEYYSIFIPLLSWGSLKNHEIPQNSRWCAVILKRSLSITYPCPRWRKAVSLLLEWFSYLSTYWLTLSKYGHVKNESNGIIITLPNIVGIIIHVHNWFHRMIIDDICNAN